jgi:urease accessory protein
MACAMLSIHACGADHLSLAETAHVQPAMQRTRGTGRLVLGSRDGASQLRELYQEGAAKIRLPRLPGTVREAVLINTAGGLTGDDRIDWQVTLENGASAAITTQACEKLYRAASGHAGVSTRLRLGENASLAWLPQETIVFDRSALRRTMDVEMAGSARLLLVESFVFGRKRMGETVREALIHDRWRVRRDGQLLHAEDFRIGPDVAGTFGASAVTGGRTALASVLLVVPEGEEHHREAARAIIGGDGGVSAWRGRLLARLVASDSLALRARLVPLLNLLNDGAALPRIWSS